MKESKLISDIDEVLGAHQFYRKKLTWNRNCGEFVDVIDLQISKSRDRFTINVGVADKFVVKECWGMADSALIEEPSCTVRARLGALLHGGRDVWWSLSDASGSQEVLSSIQNVAMPFLQRHHEIDQMIKTIEVDPGRERYPPKNFYLALLFYRKGETELCREIFKSMKLTGAWVQKASEIMDALD